MALKVIIVGAGFGGLSAAKVLSNHPDLQLTLIDRRNYHLFQPLLYQVATAGLSPAEIATPIRSIVSGGKNTKVLLGSVTKIDFSLKSLFINDHCLNYDYLILACGAKHSYFGKDEWEEFAPGLKTLEQATEIRRRILLAFELAEIEPNPELRKKLLTFVVIGGGPTGVELAGSIAEISRNTLQKDFRAIDPSRTRVILIEAGPRILASFSEKLAKRATRDLEKLGVQIWTSTRVTQVSENGVQLGSEFLQSQTLIWAAGVQPSSLGLELGVPLDSSKRVIVQDDLSLENFSNVFVIGDMAHAKDRHGNPLPGLAPVAIQQGRHVARLILSDLQKKPRSRFLFLDKGQMATIGRKKAIVQFGGLEFGGWIAWVAWLCIHIYYLIGFKNRVFVLLQWTWSYFSFRKGARLILDKEWRSVINTTK